MPVFPKKGIWTNWEGRTRCVVKGVAGAWCVPAAEEEEEEGRMEAYAVEEEEEKDVSGAHDVST